MGSLVLALLEYEGDLPPPVYNYPGQL